MLTGSIAKDSTVCKNFNKCVVYFTFVLALYLSLLRVSGGRRVVCVYVTSRTLSFFARSVRVPFPVCVCLTSTHTRSINYVTRWLNKLSDAMLQFTFRGGFSAVF